jgi:ABC-2 type transport system ATP-binding protein
MLVVNDLSKTFHGQRALDGVSFALSRGTVALLGPNGTGKSTLLRLLATLEHPDTGTLSWRGLDYHRDNLPYLRARIGYLPQRLDLPDDLTPRKLLRYLGHLREVKESREIDRLLDRLGITSLADQRLSTLSGGQLRLVGVAQALLGAPDLLLLDELLRGLSFDERGCVMRLVQDVAKLTIFSTHIPTEAEEHADHVLVLRGHCLRFCGTVDDLRRTAGGRVHAVTVPTHEATRLMQSYRVSRAKAVGDQTCLVLVGSVPPEHAAKPTAPTLEDAYLLLSKEEI